jgi:RND family efflux transporter MFP subunit
MNGISFRRALSVAAIAAAFFGQSCKKEAPAAPAPPPPTVVQAENLATVTSARLETGPILSGTLAAGQEATVRAEVAGSVLATYAEEGQRVERGAVLARIDAAVAREQELSARSGLRSAEQQLEVARRNAERAEALLKSGALPPREAETARWNVTQSEAMAADAKARHALANEQLSKTAVRAPFSGLVSRRGVRAGDTVAPGAELFTVVDPRSLRLEATVPAERFGELAVGAPVVVRPNGATAATAAVTGSIDRINPVADPVTRQIAVYATLPNADGRLVSGVFVEGRVATVAREVPSLPRTAIDRTGTEPTVLALRGGKVERVAVQLGLEDEVSERVEIVGGLVAGDQVLVGPARSLAPGTSVEIRQTS